MDEMALRPRRRSENLVLSAFDGELLVQDTLRHRAHALNQQATVIFQLSDGSRTVAEIAVLAAEALDEPVTADMVWYAIGLLQRLHLLEERVVSQENRLTRKALLTRAGVAVALASIASIAIPAAGAHASGCVGHLSVCNVSHPCCTGTCAGGICF